MEEAEGCCGGSEKRASGDSIAFFLVFCFVFSSDVYFAVEGSIHFCLRKARQRLAPPIIRYPVAYSRVCIHYACIFRSHVYVYVHVHACVDVDVDVYVSSSEASQE